MHFVHRCDVGDAWARVAVALHLEHVVPGKVTSVSVPIGIVTRVKSQEDVFHQVPHHKDEDGYPHHQ